MTRSLPRSTPAGQQADPAAILAVLDTLEARPDIELHSLMVVRHGHVIAEGWWAPYTPDQRHLLYSLSKSFTSTAAAFARAEGLLDLDDPVVKHFPEFEAEIADPRSRAIKVRHVAAMASGHDREMAQEALARDREEPVRGFLLIPPDREPGTFFAYSQPCTYTLGSIIQRNAGLPLTEYLRPRLFDPLGIGPVGWQTWPPGREQGFSGLFARTEDVAKLGQLYLQGGRWDGRQLIPAGWVAEATTKQVANPDRENPDWRQGYGFQFWMGRHGYRGDGAFGQFCVVLPEQDTVVAITASTLNMQAILDALWEHLLPGLDASGDGSGQEELSARLGGLALPACPAGAAPANTASAGPAGLAGGPFPVTGPAGELGTILVSAGVAAREDGWELTLSEPGNAVTFPARAGTWAVSSPADRHGGTIPVAASGGWADGGRLRFEVIFLETPHRMDIEVSGPDRTATAAWRIPPLFGGKLANLHCP
ncbi:MAG TPA: serine hydrolase domain-containing protein [Streptosporangiaceae bacterium]|jgi:CubicO group peptidase (beta-lactamase class C family)|nr:serine hydrolase domain-containing protein [Streptosporangiaceae bacterium]